MKSKWIRMIGQWAVLLGGPTIWFAHLGIIYAAVTIEISYFYEAGLASRLFIGGATLAALAAIAWVALGARSGRLPLPREEEREFRDFWARTATLLCLLSFIGVLWQGLPALLVDGETSHEALRGGTNVPGLELP